MIFASELPVIAALNKYRAIEDIFRHIWYRTNPDQVAHIGAEVRTQGFGAQLDTETESMDRVLASDPTWAKWAELPTTLTPTSLADLAQVQDHLRQSIPAAVPKDCPEHAVVKDVQMALAATFGGEKVPVSDLAQVREHLPRLVQDTLGKQGHPLTKMKEERVRQVFDAQIQACVLPDGEDGT